MIAISTGIFGLVIGLMAVLVAMRLRRDLAAQLGRDWRLRFLAVQGILINLCLFAVWRWVADNLGYSDDTSLWAVSCIYGPVFLVYSLSNIDWTARKFHGVGGG